jgi:hypothetical protein
VREVRRLPDVQHSLQQMLFRPHLLLILAVCLRLAVLHGTMQVAAAQTRAENHEFERLRAENEALLSRAQRAEVSCSWLRQCCRRRLRWF